MRFLNLIAGIIEKMGATLAGVVLIFAGLVMILPYFGIPAYVCQGAGMIGIGLGSIVFGRRSKKAQEMFVTSEAEKRIHDPNLPSESVVPPIQREIQKLQG